MAILNGYTTLADLKARLDITTSTPTLDSILEQAVEAASRQIDGWANRRFWTASETRYYTAEWAGALFVDDLLSVTTLKTDDDGDRVYETTWATTDYDLAPFNAALEKQPYTKIEPTPNGRYAFPRTARGIEIAGNWGYATAIPDAIVEACLILSQRFYVRKNAPFALIGSPDLEADQLTIPAVDPDVRRLVEPFRKMLAGVI